MHFLDCCTYVFDQLALITKKYTSLMLALSQSWNLLWTLNKDMAAIHVHDTYVFHPFVFDLYVSLCLRSGVFIRTAQLYIFIFSCVKKHIVTISIIGNTGTLLCYGNGWWKGEIRVTILKMEAWLIYIGINTISNLEYNTIIQQNSIFNPFWEFDLCISTLHNCIFSRLTFKILSLIEIFLSCI